MHFLGEVVLTLLLPSFLHLFGAVGLMLEPCEFPVRWRGQWFRSGLGEVNITRDSFSSKGLCVDSQGDYFLMENKEQHCHQCILMIERHDNVIQYKESFCYGEDSLREICNRIRVEATLYTLVREPSTPQPSPFLGAYSFVYNNNSGGFCRQPLSTVQQCAGDSDFRFRFRHCYYAAYTYDKEVSFQCLATWKDGSDEYMYGDFAAASAADAGVRDKEATYRCFMYKILGTIVYLAMSADATCRGLRSYDDGPLVMELTKDIRGWPTLGCSMPEWLNRTTWRDMSGRHTYVPQDRGQILEVHHRLSPDSPPHVRDSYRCIRLEESNNASKEVVMLSFTSRSCNSSYQCIRIRRRQDDVIVIDKGKNVYRETDRCPASAFQDASRHTLIPVDLPTIPCPFTGSFFAEPEISQCQLRMRSGCGDASVLDVASTCVAPPAVPLECMLSWTERHSKHVLIARRRGTPFETANCFSFRRRGQTIEFSTERHCSRGAPLLVEAPNNLQLWPEAGARCEVPTSTESVRRYTSEYGVPYVHAPSEESGRPARGRSVSRDLQGHSNRLTHSHVTVVVCVTLYSFFTSSR